MLSECERLGELGQRAVIGYFLPAPHDCGSEFDHDLAPQVFSGFSWNLFRLMMTSHQCVEDVLGRPREGFR